MKRAFSIAQGGEPIAAELKATTQDILYIKLHLEGFEKSNPDCSGIIAEEDQSGCLIQNSMNMRSSYLVCYNGICKPGLDRIKIAGALLGGTSLTFRAKHIELKGTAKAPVTVVGVHGVFMMATESATLSHVHCYVQEGAEVNLRLPEGSYMEDVIFFYMTWVDNTFIPRGVRAKV